MGSIASWGGSSESPMACRPRLVKIFGPRTKSIGCTREGWSTGHAGMQTSPAGCRVLWRPPVIAFLRLHTAQKSVSSTDRTRQVLILFIHVQQKDNQTILCTMSMIRSLVGALRPCAIRLAAPQTALRPVSGFHQLAPLANGSAHPQHEETDTGQPPSHGRILTRLQIYKSSNVGPSSCVLQVR